MCKKVKLPNLLFKTFQQISKAALIVTLTAILACETLPGNLSAAEPQYGGTLRLGWYRKPAPFDPFNVTETITAPMMELVFNRLVKSDVDGNIQPDLAARWEISPDGLVYTFYLHQDVRFHDGSPCTSQDVLHTFQIISNEKVSPRFKDHFSIVESWSAPETYVFKISLKEAYAPFLGNLLHVYVTPRHKLQNPKQDLQAFSEKPLGTGPFILTVFTEEHIRFKANANYFEGAPFLEEIDLAIYSTKGMTWSAFLRGELDAVFYLDRVQYEQAARQSDIKTFLALGVGDYAMIFNYRDPLLSNYKIRKAISLSVNKEEILAKAENGDGIAISGPFHPNSWAYDSSIASEYDPAKAAELLEEEGFHLKDGRRSKDGEALSFELLVDQKNELFLRIAKMIRQQLQESGIEIRLRLFSDYSELMEKVSSSNAGFQLYLFTYSTGTDPNSVTRYWSTGEPSNYGKYSNPQVDALFREGRKKHDKDKRRWVYKKIHKLMSEDHTAVFLYTPFIIYAHSKEVQNVESFMGPSIAFNYLKSVYKNKTERG